MLNKVGWQASTGTADPPVSNREEPIIDLVEAFRVLRRRRALIAGILVLAISGAVIYLTTTPPRYTASSMLLFDIRKSEPFQQQGYPNVATDSAFVDSQVEVLKSESIARSVIGTLNLQSDPEFAPPEGGLSAAIRGYIQGILGAGTAPVEFDQLGRVVRILQKNLTIKRFGLTYVINIDYRSLDPNKAALISNAVAEAYIVGEFDSKYQAARRANSWLQDRLRELKDLAEKTELAVAEYKAKNTAVATDAPRLNEQQIADSSSQRRIVLQDLESSARTYRALHESLLNRIAEFTEQQSFPATEARVVSSASTPLEKSEPMAVIVLGVASVLGLVGGLGAAFAREYLDGSFRSSRQVEKEIGIDCLGILPTIAPARWRLPTVVPARWRLPKGRRNAGGGERGISPCAGAHRFVVGEPLSRFAETIRDLKVAVDTADLPRPNKVIGVTSARPHEGKSLVAANLGEMIALSGCKALLIDCELRNGGLTGQFAPTAKGGLLEVIAGRAAVKDLIWHDPSTDLHFLPAVKIPVEHDQVTKEELSPAVLFRRTQLTPAGLKTVLESVQDCYDYVILDLPPITPVADVKAISHLVDAFILVIEVGRTSQQAVIDALNAAPPVFEKLLGAVLNKAGPNELNRLAS
jgi:succinoglycan biosynthesis transport protein ExoP